MVRSVGMRSTAPLVIALALFISACSGGDAESAAPTTTSVPASPGSTVVLIDSDGDPIPPAPAVPEGPLDASIVADLDLVFANLDIDIDTEAIARLGDSGDARVAWLLADLLRFFQTGDVAGASVGAFETLTGTTVEGFRWGTVTDWLIAWDTPAPPGYVDWKRKPFEVIEPGWVPFFDDADADIDWRHLSWGGVRIDAREMDAMAFPCPRGCIPALDDPVVTDAAGGDWYPDERLVFGVVVNGEARAYPRNIMEVHEMINDTLGGRRIGIPYCTLCGSAQAYFTDVVPEGFENVELRTSGLLIRSNKVMYDFTTFSIFDTFLGTALSGPLQDAGFTLEPATVITSTWGDWKVAHPDTTVVSRDTGNYNTYPLDPLGDRDDNGPIFPIGDVDQRLPVQAQVLGVVAPDGTPVAFPADAALAALAAGEIVELAGVVVRSDGAGLIAETADGVPLASHQSHWFAWSQFRPTTVVWTAFGG
ncbi:DUF3179 domain-containing protein [bacterium]|nr:DUF3179 domain-containing protein [bacterium]